LNRYQDEYHNKIVIKTCKICKKKEPDVEILKWRMECRSCYNKKKREDYSKSNNSKTSEENKITKSRNYRLERKNEIFKRET
jgi:hypothetical protein